MDKGQDKNIKVLYTIAVIAGLLAFLFFIYPSLSDAWNRHVSSLLITEYENNVVQEKDDSKIKEEIEKAKKYNEELYASGKNHVPEYTRKSNVEGFKDPKYESLLSDGDIMGYVDIPKIKEKLPIKHYTSEEVLQTSVGHLYGTSLPVGGKNTHAVISAHNALVTAKLFTDLDTMVVGDKFAINVGGKNLNYQVDEINTVLPKELDYLSIVDGEDHVTLLTCTPYGVNTHRLLVRGVRIADDVEIKPKESPAGPVEEFVDAPVFMLCLTGFGFLVAIAAIVFIWRKPKNKFGEDESNLDNAEDKDNSDNIIE